MSRVFRKPVQGASATVTTGGRDFCLRMLERVWICGRKLGHEVGLQGVSWKMSSCRQAVADAGRKRSFGGAYRDQAGRVCKPQIAARSCCGTEASCPCSKASQSHRELPETAAHRSCSSSTSVRPAAARRPSHSGFSTSAHPRSFPLCYPSPVRGWIRNTGWMQ